jgi:hypothetical protein
MTEIKQFEIKQTDINKPVLPQLLPYLEDVYFQVYNKTKKIINETPNFHYIYQYTFLTTKVVEFTETFQNLNGKEKKIIAMHCLIDILFDCKCLTPETKQNIMKTVSGTIEAIIAMSKTSQSFNVKKIETKNIIESSIIIKNALEKIIVFVKEKNYDINGIMENSLLISSKIMYLIGEYPSLTGTQKKEIVIDIFSKLLKTFTDKLGLPIPISFIDTILKIIPDAIDTLVDIAKNKFHINIKKCCQCSIL